MQQNKEKILTQTFKTLGIYDDDALYMSIRAITNRFLLPGGIGFSKYKDKWYMYIRR